MRKSAHQQFRYSKVMAECGLKFCQICCQLRLIRLLLHDVPGSGRDSPLGRQFRSTSIRRMSRACAYTY